MQNKRLRTADTLTDVGGEDAFVVDLYLDPFHEQAHVLGGRQRRRPPVLVLVLPAVFVLGPAGHDGAGLVGAGVADGAVDEVDAVEEVDHVDGDPVVEVLAVGQLHGLPEVQPRVQGGLRLLVQLEALRPRLKLALGSECLVFVEDLFQGSVHDGMRRRRRLCLLGGFLIAVEMRPSRRLCTQPAQSCCYGLFSSDSVCNSAERELRGGGDGKLIKVFFLQIIHEHSMTESIHLCIQVARMRSSFDI